MQDIIFWGRNYDKFLVEAMKVSKKLVVKNAVTDKYKILFTSTPLQINERGEFMFLVRAAGGIIGELNKCSSIENLGAYVAVLNSPPKREIYDRIYPNEPYDIIDEEGNTITITPPERFGEFDGEI